MFCYTNFITELLFQVSSFTEERYEINVWKNNDPETIAPYKEIFVQFEEKWVTHFYATKSSAALQAYRFIYWNIKMYHEMFQGLAFSTVQCSWFRYPPSPLSLGIFTICRWYFTLSLSVGGRYCLSAPLPPDQR